MILIRAYNQPESSRTYITSRFGYSYNRFGWLVGWLVGGLVGWLVGLLFGCLVGWLIIWLVGWMIGWLGWKGYLN